MGGGVGGTTGTTGTSGSGSFLGWGAGGSVGQHHSLTLAESVNRALLLDPARIRLPDLDSIIEMLQARIPSGGGCGFKMGHSQGMIYI